MSATFYGYPAILPARSFDRDRVASQVQSSMCYWRVCMLWLVAMLLLAPALEARDPQEAPLQDVVLITLDTTRVEALSCYSSSQALDGQVSQRRRLPGVATPVIDALAARGLRFARAVTSAPLTLPAHATLLTGLEPPLHGVRDNATDALAVHFPTLATVLDARGYDTAAVVGSRVLDRRFGLDRGFDVYDDSMLAEQIGEYGYPERDAAAVVDRAIEWLAARRDAPYFLWLHFYDPHAPYAAPTGRGGSDEERYVAEVRFVDQQIGRLLEALPSLPKTELPKAESLKTEVSKRGPSRDPLIAVVGDHGESLGEHGERTHGLLLHGSVLDVPLILAGPGVPHGVVEQAVATRRLASTLLSLIHAEGADEIPGPPLPGVIKAAAAKEPSKSSIGIYSETLLPATAYGWSPLRSSTTDRWRLIEAPRPELYDLAADPEELSNLIDDKRRIARGLEADLRRFERQLGSSRSPATVDPQLARELAQLGYLSGWSAKGSDLDPKDGLKLLERFEQAKALTDAGQPAEAVEMLEALVKANPGNVPFMSRLASSLLAAGRSDDAIAAYRRAVSANPDLEFTRMSLASALARLGRLADAEDEVMHVLKVNPRFADAWILRADLASDKQGAKAAILVLEEAVAAGTSSARILLRLGGLHSAAGDHAAAKERLRQATDLAPGWAVAWIERSRIEWLAGDNAGARTSVEQALLVASPGSNEAMTAQRLLSSWDRGAQP